MYSNKLNLLLVLLFTCTYSSCQVVNLDQEIIPSLKRLSLEGNIEPMKDILRNTKNIDSLELEIYERFKERFIQQVLDSSNTGDRFTNDAILIYRKYWIEVLMKTKKDEDALENLKYRLVSLLKNYNIMANESEAIEKTKELIESKGFYVLNGLIAPHQELMVWKSQHERKYQIELTDTIVTRKVMILEDFYSRGWLNYASLGTNNSTGWTSSDGILFVKASAYDLDSESFINSYLRHEARHSLDLVKYTDIASTELEYRAKLTELIHAEQNLYSLIKKFIIEGDKNSTSPHGKANYELISKLSSTLLNKSYEGDMNVWNKIGEKKIQIAAKQLLLFNSKELDKA